MSYEVWVEQVFDHPVDQRNGGGWWDDEAPDFSEVLADPARTLAYLTRLFRDGAALKSRYTRGQIGQGFWFLMCGACSDFARVLFNESLPWEDRRAGVEATGDLFETLMVPLYGDHLEPRSDETNDDRWNSCFMWWDLWPIWPGNDTEEHRRLRETGLGVLERILSLPSEACRESALHGLGHWHSFAAERTEPIVRAFLAKETMSDPLRAYAEAAADGNVL